MRLLFLNGAARLVRTVFLRIRQILRANEYNETVKASQRYRFKTT